MRIGVSSRGNAWVSLGPIGWLLLLPLLAVYAAILAVVAVVVGICRLTAWAIRTIRGR
jgi:hypothetical protein